jgi:hypothetical protein
MTASSNALRIASVGDADDATWDRTWSGCSYATFFHSREWAEIWSAYSGGASRPIPRHVLFSDGATALLPLSCRRRRGTLVRQYSLAPAVSFGGWISCDALGPAHRDLLAELLLSSCRNLVWRRNPYEAEDFLRHDHPAWTPDSTRALRLDEDLAGLRRRSSKGHRSAASKAVREGVSVSIAAQQEDWHAFFGLYAESVARWGDAATSAYDESLLDIMRERDSGDIALWLAFHDGVPVAGALCLYARRHVAYWLGAASRSAFPLRPVHLLMYEAIRHARESGREWFDFNPSGGHQGVDGFKKGFGAIELPAPVLTLTSPGSRAVEGVSRRMRRLRP